MAKEFLLCSAVSGFISVALGAFGAHALKDSLDEYHLKIFHTGVQYQFYHCFALAAVGLLLERHPHPWLRASGWAFAAGTIVFSGSLYILALTGTKWWGAVTPLGGLSFLAGWCMLTFALAKITF